MVSAEYIHQGIPELIKELYAGKICQHADLDMLINHCLLYTSRTAYHRAQLLFEQTLCCSRIEILCHNSKF